MIDDENIAIVVPNDVPIDFAVDATSAEIVNTYFRMLQSPKSEITVTESLRRITRLFGMNDVRAFAWHRLTLDEMLKIREALVAQKYPPSTVNMSLSAMRRLLKIGHALDLVTSQQNAALMLLDNITGARITKGRELSQDEIKALWRACDRLEPLETLQQRALLVVLVGGGLRREEVCRLPLNSLRDRDLYVIGKGNKERVLPVDDWMDETLVEWIDTRNTLEVHHNFMFCLLARGNKPLSPWSLWSKIAELAKRAGLVDEENKPTLAPHDFRRTFASRLLELGYDMSEVQRLMGHASMATTQLYDKRAMKALADKRRNTVMFDLDSP